MPVMLNSDANYGYVKCWLMPNSRGELAMNGKLRLKKDLQIIRVHYTFTVVRQARDYNIPEYGH